jgi:hypothetical protein
MTSRRAGPWCGLVLLTGIACNRDSHPVVTGRPADGVGGAVVRTSELVAGGRTDHGTLRNPYEGQRMSWRKASASMGGSIAWDATGLLVVEV